MNTPGTQKPLFHKPTPQLEEINISDIEPWLTTGRNAVLKSVNALGVITPIQVEQLPPGGQHKYRVIDGRRRLDAATNSNMPSIPAVVFPHGGGFTYNAMAAGANLARAFAPIDEAKQIEVLVNEAGFTPEALAKELGISIGTIRQRLKLVNLPNELREAVHDKRISPTVATAAASLTPDEQQEALRVLNENNKLSKKDINNIRLAKKTEALGEIQELFAPPAPPEPLHVFEMAVREALSEGLSFDDIYDMVDKVTGEHLNVRQ